MATTQTESKRGARARKGEDGQEAVLRHETVANKMDHLLTLFRRLEVAKTDLSDAIKAVAEVSGFNSGQIRSFLAARAGERFQERRRDVRQLSILFEEVGE